MTDANGKLACWWLCLPEFDFDIIHKDGIKNLATNSLLRLETGGADCIEISHDPFDLVIADNKVNREAPALQPYTVCHLCDHEEQEAGNVMPDA